MTDGPFAWIMIIVALLLIFGGGKKLPEIGKGLGTFMKEFRKAQKDDDAPVAKVADSSAATALNGVPAQEKLPQSNDRA